MPQRVDAKEVDDTGAWCIYFDGGCSYKSKEKQGAGGYVVFAPDGMLQAGRGVYLGASMTNNTSKSRGLVSAMECVGKLRSYAHMSHVVVHGDL